MQSNLIGTDPTGTSAIPNQGNGITLTSASGNVVRDNQISGNTFEGVEIFASASNVVADNLIGSGVESRLTAPQATPSSAALATTPMFSGDPISAPTSSPNN